MSSQDIALLPSRYNVLIIVVEVKTSGPPHVLKLWLVVSKGMLPVE